MARPEPDAPETPQDRIHRMEAAGTITPAQATRLLASLEPRPLPARDRTARRSQVTRWIGVVLAIGLLLTVVGSLFAPSEPTAVQDVASALNQPGGVAAMNPTSKLIAIALLLIVPVLSWAFMHNSLVTREEAVFEAWAQTESTYQRRADLMPALVESVSRFVRHESETLESVTRERTPDDERLAAAIEGLVRAQEEAAEIQHEDPASLIEDEDRLALLFARQTTVGKSMGHLFAVAEAYPELRSADQFLELQAQIEGTENRINVARQRFNDAVGTFNATLRRLPWNLVAGIGGFQRKAYFQAEGDARDAPGLDFD